MMHLNFPGELTADTFLRDFWQQRPLLMPGGLAGYHCPLTAEELAGLACEEEIESRIVLEKDGSKPWEGRSGPFSEADFASLPESHWTLLVQDVDKHIEEVADLLEPFQFIPDWRLDDIMISYAADQGSVGPHIDDYDVFLIQVEGERRWLVDSQPGEESNHIPGLDLRILPEINPDNEWLMKPGDVLYLPPNVPHWGIAEGDGCMTCSVGFRAPTFQEMASAWFDELIQCQVPDGRYRDGSLQLQQAKAEISQHSLTRVRDLLQSFTAQNPRQQERWFGRFITEPKIHLQVDPQDQPLQATDFLTEFRSQGRISHNGWARFAFINGSEALDYLYVSGTEYPLGKEREGFLQLLTGVKTLSYNEMSSWLENDDCLQLMTQLYNDGYLALPDE
ncbi:MAG: cupin domain-containing protein [Candidatus Sedimenticola sp. (ex Thyasira tokunagai)]